MIATLMLIADSGFDNHMDMGDWGAGWWILMAFLMFAFWALVVVGIVWLIRTLMAGRNGHGGVDAIELLDRRLASGEISPEEYRERRAVLRGTPDAPTDETGTGRPD